MIWVIDIVTALGKVNILNTAALNAVATSLSPKLFNIANFHSIANGLINNPNTHIENNDSVMAKPLNTLQFLSNNYFII